MYNINNRIQKLVDTVKHISYSWHGKSHIPEHDVMKSMSHRNMNTVCRIDSTFQQNLLEIIKGYTAALKIQIDNCSVCIHFTVTVNQHHTV